MAEPITVDLFLLNDERCPISFGSEQMQSYANQLIPLYIHTPDASHAKQWDELLWSHSPECFIAHHCLHEPHQQFAPMTIGFTKPPVHATVLVNNHPEVPPFFQQFNHIIELFNARNIETARKHYRHYQKHGCHITHHDLRKEEYANT